MRRNLIELAAMAAVSAALVIGAMDRPKGYIAINGVGTNDIASSASRLAIDSIEFPAVHQPQQQQTPE